MRLLVIFFLAALVFLLPFLIWGASFEAWITRERLQALGPWSAVAGVALLWGDLFLPVPSTLVMSALGYVHGWWWGGCLATLGSLAAGLTAYGLARCLGPRSARWLLGDLDYQRGQQLGSRLGPLLVAISRPLPLLAEVVACFAGLLKMPFRRFLGALLCGVLPLAFAFAALGQAGLEHPRWALAASLAVPPLLWLVASRVSRRGLDSAD